MADPAEELKEEQKGDGRDEEEPYLPAHDKTQSIASMMRSRLGPPLDFSWKDLATLEDLIDEEPYAGKKKGTTRPPPAEGEPTGSAAGGGGDSAGPAAASGAVGVEAGEVVEPPKRQAKLGKLQTTTLRLNNNCFTTLSGMSGVLSQIMDTPDALNWVDLSYNQLTLVEDALAAFGNLGVVYLHANNIENLNDLKPLRKLTKLRKLTLHGNPVEEKKNYRFFVIELLPTLKELDFCPITRLDRDKARTWRSIYKKKKRADD